MSLKRVIYEDVAEHAGVSIATVSYVLNDGPRPVSAETRSCVEDAIAALGYYPNEVARSLRLQQSSTIGLVIPHAANPVYAEMAQELERSVRRQGFSCYSVIVLAGRTEKRSLCRCCAPKVWMGW
ncbi:MAG: LacI family DNA-binding transcriptional regulator [Caldilineaceae bacterium]